MIRMRFNWIILEVKLAQTHYFNKTILSYKSYLATKVENN